MEDGLLPTEASSTHPCANRSKHRFLLAERIDSTLPAGSINYFRAFSTALAARGVGHSTRPKVEIDVIEPAMGESRSSSKTLLRPTFRRGPRLIDSPEDDEHQDEEEGDDDSLSDDEAERMFVEFIRTGSLDARTFEAEEVNSSRRRALEVAYLVSQISDVLPDHDNDLPRPEKRKFSKSRNFFRNYDRASYVRDLVAGLCWVDSNAFNAINSWLAEGDGPTDTLVVFTVFLEITHSWSGAVQYVTSVTPDSRSVRVTLKHNAPQGSSSVKPITVQVSIQKMARLILYVIVHCVKLTPDGAKRRGVHCRELRQALEAIYRGASPGNGTPFELYEQFKAQFSSPSDAAIEEHVGQSDYQIRQNSVIGGSSYHARFFAVIARDVSVCKKGLVRHARVAKVRIPISRDSGVGPKKTEVKVTQGEDMLSDIDSLTVNPAFNVLLQPSETANWQSSLQQVNSMIYLARKAHEMEPLRHAWSGFGVSSDCFLLFLKMWCFHNHLTQMELMKEACPSLNWQFDDTLDLSTDVTFYFFTQDYSSNPESLTTFRRLVEGCVVGNTVVLKMDRREWAEMAAILSLMHVAPFCEHVGTSGSVRVKTMASAYTMPALSKNGNVIIISSAWTAFFSSSSTPGLDPLAHVNVNAKKVALALIWKEITAIAFEKAIHWVAETLNYHHTCALARNGSALLWSGTPVYSQTTLKEIAVYPFHGMDTQLRCPKPVLRPCLTHYFASQGPQAPSISDNVLKTFAAYPDDLKTRSNMIMYTSAQMSADAVRHMTQTRVSAGCRGKALEPVVAGKYTKLDMQVASLLMDEPLHFTKNGGFADFTVSILHCMQATVDHIPPRDVFRRLFLFKHCEAAGYKADRCEALGLLPGDRILRNCNVDAPLVFANRLPCNWPLVLSSDEVHVGAKARFVDQDSAPYLRTIDSTQWLELRNEGAHNVTDGKDFLLRTLLSGFSTRTLNVYSQAPNSGLTRVSSGSTTVFLENVKFSDGTDTLVPDTWCFLWGRRGTTELNHVQLNVDLRVDYSQAFYQYGRPERSVMFMPTSGDQMNCGYDAGMSNYKRPRLDDAAKAEAVTEIGCGEPNAPFGCNERFGATASP